MMGQIEKANLAELKEFAKEKGVGHPATMELGALRLHLRQWLIRTPDGNTEATFGKHRGKTFEQIWSQDAQYVAWSVTETAAKKEASWKLVQLATWGVLSGRVADPFNEKMHLDHGSDRSLPPLCLASILDIDENIYQVGNEKEEKSKQGLNLKLTGRAAGSEPSSEPTKEELIKQIGALRQELRALKEEKEKTPSPRQRKAPKE